MYSLPPTVLEGINMPGISDVVLFGIKSGLKIAKQGRQAYIEGTISKALVLPLPNYEAAFSVGSATNFFLTSQGTAQLNKDPRLQDIFTRITNTQSFTEEEEAFFISSAMDFQLLHDLESNIISSTKLANQGFTAGTLKSLVTVRQFAHANNRAFPSAVQRVLGSLIEVGVDAFSQFPGIVDEQSATGRALKGFLNSIENLNFGSDNVSQLARSLFISAIETIGQNADLLGADEKIEVLVQSVSSGLIRDLSERIDKLGGNLIEREHVERWGNLVLRSVLSNVGSTILANPKSLGIEDPAKQALVSSVGTSILAAIIDEKRINLRGLFSRQGLDQVVKASLNSVAEFPELVGPDGAGLQKIISQVALGLANNEHILNRDMLPEAVRLIIEKTAQNAEFVWPAGFDNANKHILVKAAVQFLNQFSSLPPEGQTWRPAFSKSLLTGLLDSILEETIQNPGWVSELGINDQTVLGEATRIALDILQEVPTNQLSIETGAHILRSVIQAVSRRLDFIDEIEINGKSLPAIAAAMKPIIQAILSKDLDPKILWVTARGEVFKTIMNTALEVLAKIGINEETINQVLDVIEKNKERILAGGRWILDEVLMEIKNLATKPTT